MTMDGGAAEESAASAADSGRSHRSIRQLRSPGSQRPCGFSLVPAPGVAGYRGQDQGSGDQDSRHAPAAADGSVTARGHADPRLAHGGDSSEDHNGLRSGPGRLLADATPLRHTETESAWPIGTTGPTLLLSAHRQRGTR